MNLFSPSSQSLFIYPYLRVFFSKPVFRPMLSTHRSCFHYIFFFCEHKPKTRVELSNFPGYRGLFLFL
uniref:Uncharacterized protein n=1 Tax=Anguilla anguilla TaxID=7936 RepID=A0A0E9SVJ0_ANGAN